MYIRTGLSLFHIRGCCRQQSSRQISLQLRFRSLSSSEAMTVTRKFFFGGNWKSNGTVVSVNELVKKLNSESFDDRVDVVVAPIEIHLGRVKDTINSKIKVAAQNVSSTGTGAYTGETSAATLKDFGIEWVIIGHSERRALYHESNQVVTKKLAASVGAGVNVIACVGETLDDRKSNKTFDVIKEQLAAVCDGISSQTAWKSVVIAYEPVWSIGTGLTASPAQAEEVHVFIREQLSTKISPEVAANIRIIYGGSVKPDNSVELIMKENIDGFLIGGASLDAKSFAQIANSPKAGGRLN